MSEAVIISIITFFGGIAVAYITYIGSKKVQQKKAEKKPKDRMEQMFDGYERLIKQMAEEDERKATIIRDQQAEIIEMKKKLNTMEENLAAAQDDLIESHKSKQLLTKELDKMRLEYRGAK